ncbi:MAG: 2-oxoacid:ferredoxin oxidoreductase subunit beta [Candidatus Latescibacterota bacterium]|nr:MAG: 2-oxoacid:ferredoxin oxidoreductase subunit beta [Candidatus Latescibacterota bacterium]
MSDEKTALLTRKDFTSDQEVRWCPGCGDYSILAQMQKALPGAGVAPHKYVFVSGIGCSSRFPYYMKTYGFHTIHGRAPTFATGIKVANPDLSVWIATGDGDGLSIGGNHLLHVLRRNLDVKILLFNNRIYGLTKGQYSPTSELGKKTRSSPLGSIDYPVHACCFAIAAEATFVARTIDTDTKHLASIIGRASQHAGAAFIEIFQNCVIFNDGAFDHVTEAAVRAERTVELVHGKPVVFGAARDKGVRQRDGRLEVVTLGGAITEDDLLVHREDDPDSGLAFQLARMEDPDFPVAMGVFRAVRKPTYDGMMEEQVRRAREAKGAETLDQILRSGECWVID